MTWGNGHTDSGEGEAVRVTIPSFKRVAALVAAVAGTVGIASGIANAFYVRSTLYEANERKRDNDVGEVRSNVRAINVNLDGLVRQLDRIEKKLDR